MAGRRWKPLLPWALFAVTAIALLAVSFLESPGALRPALRKFVFRPDQLVWGETRRRPSPVVISPNGKHITFVVGEETPQLWIRDLDTEAPYALKGGHGGASPFWSPDSEHIAFVTSDQLKKVSIDGGQAITLCRLPGIMRGGTWSGNGDKILFAAGGRESDLYEVSAAGGKPQLVLELEGFKEGDGILDPHFLGPIAGSIVFSAGSPTTQNITAKHAEDDQLHEVIQGVFPVYSTTGHILYQQGPLIPNLWAVPFSADTLRVTGDAFPIKQNAVRPSVSADGTLVYSEPLPEFGPYQLVWRDRNGHKLEAVGQTQLAMSHPELSPDETFVAVQGHDDVQKTDSDIFLHELARATKTPLTFAPSNEATARWSPSGNEIAFFSDRGANTDVFVRRSDGVGEAVPVATSEGDEFPRDWSPDGRFLLYQVSLDAGGPDLWIADKKRNGDGFETRPFIENPSANFGAGQFSRDGRAVAYVSGQTGRNEVWVAPFPEGSPSKKISTNGGIHYCPVNDSLASGN